MTIINRIGTLILHIDIKVRHAISLASLTCIFVLFLVRIMQFAVPWPFYYTDAQWNIVGLVLLMIFAFFSIDQKLERVEVNKGFAIIYIATAISILVPSILHHTGDGLIVYSLIMLIGFPIVYFIFASQKAFAKLFCLLSWGVVISGCFFVLLCIIIAPVDSTIIDTILSINMAPYYSGPTSNPNRAGYYTMACFLGALYLFVTYDWTKKRNIIACVFLALIMSLFFGIALLSGCRAAIIMIFIAIVLCILFQIRTNVRKIIITQIIIICFSLILSVPFATILLNLPPDKYTVEAIEKREALVVEEIRKENEGYDAIEYIEPEHKISDYTKLDKLLSRRVTIWEYYIGEVGFEGHDVHQIPGTNLMIGGHEDGMRPSDIQFIAPHNAPIDIAYRCGVIAGIMHLLLMIVSVAFSIRAILNKKFFNRVVLFSSIMSFGYFVYAMLSMEWVHFHFIFVFFFFMSVGPYMFNIKNTIK